LTPSVSEEAQTAAREKISLIRNKIIAKLLLLLPERIRPKETRANGGSLIIQNTGYSF
jgi:peptidyl-prolyl cis-trans isomerase SurA